MQVKVYETFCKTREMDEVEIAEAIAIVSEAEVYFDNKGELLDSVSKETLRKFLDDLIVQERNSLENFLALSRYFYSIDNKARYIDFTALFGSRGVLDSILNRVDTNVCADFEQPPFGLDPKMMPEYTKHFMNCMARGDDEENYFKVLAGNNHSIPKEAMLPEKELFEACGDLDKYLVDRHKRKILELKEHMTSNKVWFEQIITEEVLSFVESNQEILSAVRDGNYLYVTKIPFDTKAFLEAASDNLKRYYACHCPFVREGVKEGRMDIDPNWCYCSGGFAKFPFEVMFDEVLEVELLETPLKGDFRCRFRIEIPERITGKYTVKE